MNEVPSIEQRETDARSLEMELKADEQRRFEDGRINFAELAAMDRAGEDEVQRVRDGDVPLGVAKEEIDCISSDAIRRIDDAEVAFDDPEAEDEDDECQYGCPCGH